MSDISDQLRELMNLGYRFVHPRNAAGQVVAVTGVRTHHDVIDVFQLYGERDANAVRMSANEVDFLSPRNTLWQSYGTAESVINELLALPDPDETGTVATAGTGRDTAGVSGPKGVWVSTRPGRSTWLPASA